MASLRQRIVTLVGATAPGGRVTHLRLRASIDLSLTLALATSALAAAFADQLLAHGPGRRSPAP
jgi:hypothetical protein